MANVKWIKINVDMFDDEKIKIVQSMPDGDAMLVVWIKLITLAGKTNDGGYIYIHDNMPYTEEMLAVIMNKPINTIRLALSTFISLGMLENDDKGIYLVKFEKHQSLDRLEQIKEQNRKRVAEHRAKKKQLQLENKCNVTSNVTVTQSNAIDIDKEEDKEIDKDKNKNKDKEYFADANLNSIFLEFLTLRKKLKAVNSDRAINTLLKTLNQYDDATKYKMIENSIVNSWKSVYELKPNKVNASNTYKRDEVVPDWIKNKDIKAEQMDQDELNEIEDMFKEFKPNPELQERLKRKYGK